MRRILPILIICLLSFQLKAQTNDNLIKGYVQLEEKNYQLAIDFFTTQLENNQAPKAYLYRGICHYYLNHSDQAMSDFLKAFNVGGIEEAQLWLAKTYAKNGEAQQAVKNLDEYIAGQGYINTKDILKDSVFRTIQSTNSWQGFTLNRIVSNEENIAGEVTYLLNSSKNSEGVEYISDLLLDNTDPYLYYYRALFYKKSGNLALAYADIKMANNVDP